MFTPRTKTRCFHARIIVHFSLVSNVLWLRKLTVRNPVGFKQNIASLGYIRKMVGNCLLQLTERNLATCGPPN